MSRPTVLFPYFATLGSLKGIGSKTLARLHKLCGETVIDLLFHLPREIIDRRHWHVVHQQAAHKTLEAGLVTLRVRINAHQRGAGRRAGRQRPHTIICTIVEPMLADQQLELNIVYFHTSAEYLQQQYPTGKELLISGTLEWRRGTRVMLHPEYHLTPEKADELPAFEALYPLTQGLNNRLVRQAIAQSLRTVPAPAEWQRDEVIARLAIPDFHTALQQAHHPQTPQDLPLNSPPALRRLALDELLAQQLALQLVRAKHQRQPGLALPHYTLWRQQLQQALDFSLSATQQQAIEEIRQDMQQPTAMLRLLMGDVGSGKTIVALMAMLDMLEHGQQCALMVPSETLARQHADTINRLLRKADIDVPCVLVLGSHQTAARREVYQALATESPLIAVGTHALIQDHVQFDSLGMIVIDEQHRFGVQQRWKLTQKTSHPSAHSPEILCMTATPIPRSLLMCHYGDVDVSRLIGRNPHARPVKTAVIQQQRCQELVGRLKNLLDKADKVFWVCPLREESEHSENANAEQRYQDLIQHFPKQVFLLHGAMKTAERTRVMQEFRTTERGAILVATTVIEVGIDIHDASTIIIESAERFGLAQLHQLRGRVGRGGKDGHCILLCGEHLSSTAQKRLEMMRQSDDGFALAEADLELRGGGEILGTRQSGLPHMRLADLTRDVDLLSCAFDEARYIIGIDAELQTPRGQALRQLLYLFGRDHAVRLLRSG